MAEVPTAETPAAEAPTALPTEAEEVPSHIRVQWKWADSGLVLGALSHFTAADKNVKETLADLQHYKDKGSKRPVHLHFKVDTVGLQLSSLGPAQDEPGEGDCAALPTLSAGHRGHGKGHDGSDGDKKTEDPGRSHHQHQRCAKVSANVSSVEGAMCMLQTVAACEGQARKSKQVKSSMAMLGDKLKQLGGLIAGGVGKIGGTAGHGVTDVCQLIASGVKELVGQTAEADDSAQKLKAEASPECMEHFGGLVRETAQAARRQREEAEALAAEAEKAIKEATGEKQSVLGKVMTKIFR